MSLNGRRKSTLILLVLITFIISCKKTERNGIEKTIFEPGTVVRVNVKPGLVVRTEPSANSKKILEIPFNESTQIISCKNTNETLLNLSGPWCQIKFLNKEGWVFSPFLKSEYSRELAFKISYGKAIRELPLPEPAPISDRLVLYRMSVQGHDIGIIQFVLDEKSQKGKMNSCRYWSGPPNTEESSQRYCDSSDASYKRNKNDLSINGKQYKWDGRFKGFISLDDNFDWKEIFAQAFDGKPHPEGDYNAWVLEESNCRFFEGEPYGGAEASFLCEKLGFDDSCQCFEK
ncbi:SH3 domain-containing protein [Leptospira sp. 201903071]|uniref:SH3 domain-containing protein n=1 Tax=Leptospira ainazelensis TaxID=2810034 RepID=UPI001962536B|nr:SH3 domain-containing protein [Leptospira ainazelensis]MBM9502261.1 SH3 domain-containing protein [Leptospira ainazelensis]